MGAAPTSGRAKQQPAATMLGLQEVIEMIECRRQKQDISAKQTKTAQDPALPRND